MTSRELVHTLIGQGYRLVFWPDKGDLKGPTEEGWTTRSYNFDDYTEGSRVGMMTGVEVQPGQYNLDIDIDYKPASLIAQALLPPTGFVFGRGSYPVTHAIYHADNNAKSFRYEDIDKTCVIEIRGTKADGTLGMQTMMPPSMWEDKRGNREQLTLLKFEGASKVPTTTLVQRTTYAAVGMLLAKHLGINGFGHEARLAWAGFLLRAGVSNEDLIVMGEAMSAVCNNREIADVRRAVESTDVALKGGSKKVKGGPALAKIIGPKGKLVVGRINEWLGRDADFVRDGQGRVIPDHQGNIARALEVMEVELAYHSFSERMIVQMDGHKHLIDDAIVEGLWLRIDRDMQFRPTFNFFEKVIKNIGRESTHHAVRDYLDGLTWDGTPRINEWLIAYAGADDTPYVRAVSPIMMIAAVRRVRQPGCKYDEMVVLESGQGMQKSSALRALCPDETWFSDDLPLNVDAKQIIERTLGKWIIEASDLAGKRKAEQDQLKSMLSRQVDGPARLAYAHNPVERARQFILVGTTNSAAYLADSTGARRYWPIKVNKFDVVAVTRDRNQLWAEAAHRESRGESIRLHEDLWAAASVEQEKRHAHDAWEDMIRVAMRNVMPSGDGRRRVATTLIWDALGVESSRRDRTGGLRISEIMQKLGFKPTTVRVPDEGVVRGYMTLDETKLSLADEAEMTESTRVNDEDIPF